MHAKKEAIVPGAYFIFPIIKNVKKRKIPMVQMMRDEALKAFELWDKKTDKVKY